MLPKGSSQALIMIVADEPVTANLWGVVLNDLGVSPLIVKSISSAAQILEDTSPDIIVVDISHYKTKGIEICTQLYRTSAAPIMLLTPINNEAHMLEAYQAGVDECLIKPVSPSHFLAKISVMLRRIHQNSTEDLGVLKSGDLTLNPSAREVIAPGGRRCRLTRLEFRVLQLLMNHPDLVFQPADLVRRVWGLEAGENNVLIKNVIYRLRKKLESNPAQPRYLRTETGGYVLRNS
jgi:DNA-binding response OmpR family regulator